MATKTAVGPGIPTFTTQELNRRLGQDLPHVQGIAETNLDTLTLRNGKGLVASIGAALRDEGATITRNLDGGDTIVVTAHDPKLELLNNALLSSTFDAHIDGLWFRYIGAGKSGKTATLNFLEREVAILKSLYGPKKVFRSKSPGDGGSTRAEFIASLVAEARPRIPTYIPEVHKVMPVATGKKAQPDPDNRDADAISTPGFSGGVTVKGVKPNAEQLKVATDAMTVADQYNANRLSRLAMFCAMTQENNITASTNDGPFAFLDSTAAQFGVDKHDTKACAKLFLVDGIAGEMGAIEYAEKNPNADPGDIAQYEEASAYPGLYSQWRDEAAKWVDAWGGSSGVSGDTTVTTTEAYSYEVKKNENYWAAIKRLAAEVNYRAFCSSGRFFYVAEPKLFAQRVRLAIVQEDGDILTHGVDEVDFDYHGLKASSEVTVTARARQWACPPGTVVTLKGYGPASAGTYFPDPRLQVIGRTEKGKPIRAALDSARPTNVGRYLVSSITSTLDSDSCEIKLKKPTEPLPEPAAQTSTKTVPGDPTVGTGVVGGGEMGDLSGTPKEIVDRVVNWAHEKLGFTMTPESVEAANATHGLTSSGSKSDHQGPPDYSWAADISNGITTPEETQLAAAIATAFDIPWSGAGLITHDAEGFQMQLIYKAADHYDHVHFGLHKV